MTIDECEDAYDHISKRVFGKKSGLIIRDEQSAFVTGSYIYEAGPLEDAIKEVVSARLGDPNAPMKESEPACKVLVVF